MSDLGAAGEPVHSGGKSVEPGWPHTSDGRWLEMDGDDDEHDQRHPKPRSRHAGPRITGRRAKCSVRRPRCDFDNQRLDQLVSPNVEHHDHKQPCARTSEPSERTEHGRTQSCLGRKVPGLETRGILRRSVYRFEGLIGVMVNVASLPDSASNIGQDTGELQDVELASVSGGLVVISIIPILVGLLLPAVNSVREP